MSCVEAACRSRALPYDAFAFYRSVFGGDDLGVIRYRDFSDNPMAIPEDELDRIAHIALPIGGQNVLMVTDRFGVGWMVNYGDKEFPAGDGEG